jgi:hypothetical protein
VASSTVQNTYSNRTVFFGKFIGGIRGRMDYYFGDCINSTTHLHELRQNVYNRFLGLSPLPEGQGAQEKLSFKKYLCLLYTCARANS